LCPDQGRTIVRYLDIESWARRSQFEFFKQYDLPFFNVCTELDVTELYEWANAANHTFFTASLYCSLRAANEVEAFRYRIRENKVIVHDVVHAGSTVLNDDGTFSFCYFDYSSDFRVFKKNVNDVLAEHRATKGGLHPKDDRDDMIHYSVVPWIRFTSVSHPRRLRPADSVPKIVFGKYHESGERLMIPISVEVHHAMMDGLHVANYLELAQKLARNPADYF
jgi:chloramphenicol O-acetyltransferase type A